MTEQTESPFSPTPGGPKIILLDLQSTLSENFSEMGPNPKPENIRDKERYRNWLVERLKQIQVRGWEVHLFTVRYDNRRQATLESVKSKTDWQPDGDWFNDLKMDGPPKVKSRLLDRLIEQCKPAALYAFESNKETRKMFRSRKVPCRRTTEEHDLSDADVERFQNGIPDDPGD